MKRVFLGLVGGMVAYELVALGERRRGDTISEIIWSTTTHHAILPFAMGVLMGHLFWQRAAAEAVTVDGLSRPGVA